MSVSSGRCKAVVSTILCLSMIVGFLPFLGEDAAAQSSKETLVVALQQDLPDFNIWNLASNSEWKRDVISWGFDGLMSLDYDMLPYPALAESFTFDEPTLTWTFNLRQGVKFHDGSTMTADDVVFIYKAAREGTVYASELINAFDTNNDGALSQAEADAAIVKTGTYTVRMTMGSPYAQFLSTTARIPVLPKSIWQNHVVSGGLLDPLWNDPSAAIGTGPFRYLEGADNDYRLIEAFEAYWGRNLTTPLGYRMYPLHINQVYFKVFTSIDSAILALQSGAVDYIPWAIASGRLPSLMQDPSVRLNYLSDNGYFYLAFNEKFDPMCSLPFRKAVSHVIDKDQIVNVYMGGFGSKGDATEPPFWGKDAWYNDTVEKYPFDPDFSTPNALLDAAGLTDQNGDGWRDLPDGTPMEKITILTPPADYDSVRSRAGQVIAKNMRDGLQINAEAKALDFDTLVARLQSMDYQMLIIGWSLTSDPVGNVFDLMGPRASSNTFAFWSETNPNPFYSDLFGVVTRADAATQALADEVLRLDALAKGSFNVSDQIKYTRWAEGVIAEAVPINILYYRVNVQAHSSSWVGWYPHLGTLLNMFSLAYVEDTGGAVGFRDANAVLNTALNAPSKVGIANTVDAYVMAIDDSGRPVPGADVSIAVAGYGSGPVTVSAIPSSGTTDSNGTLSFGILGQARGRSNISVTVTKGTGSSVAMGVIESVGPKEPTLVLDVSLGSLVLQPGESTTVSLRVHDENGIPVEGANVSVDLNLVGYGAVDTPVVFTDAGGNATMTYTAPATLIQLNAHLMVTLCFSVSKAGYLWTDSAGVNVVIFNGQPPQWVVAQIDSATTTALSRAANTTTIAVSAVDAAGTPLPDHALSVAYSDPSRVFSPVQLILTDGSGAATFDVQLKDTIDSYALRVTICNTTVLNSVPATITLTHAGTGTVPSMYGGYMAWDTHYLDPAVDWIQATAYVWDEAGAPADGINASLVVSGTSYGSLVWNDYIQWDSTYEGWGINIVTSEDRANLATTGPFTTFFDYANWEQWYNWEYLYWDWGMMVPVDVVAGAVTVGIYALDWAPIDLIGQVFLVPEGIGVFDDVTLSYRIDGPCTISGDYVIGRAYSVAEPVFQILDPVLEARRSAYDETEVLVGTFDENNAVFPGAYARVYQNSLRGNTDYAVYPSGGFITDMNGVGNATITAVPRSGTATSASIQTDVYVKAWYPYAISMIAQSRIFIQTQHCFISLDPVTTVGSIGDTIPVTATVVDISGAPLSGMTVDLAAEAGAVAVPSLATGADGQATFFLDTSNITSAPVGYIPVRARTDGPAYSPAFASMMIPVRETVPPVADAGSDVNATVGDRVYFDGLGSTDNFAVVNYTWTLTYDGSSVVLYGPAPSFLFLIEGTYSVALNVTDRAGNYDTDVVVVTVSALIPEFQSLILPIAGLAVIVALLRSTRTRRR